MFEPNDIIIKYCKIRIIANVDAPTINDIDIEDVVFDTGVQNVRGPKYFLQDVIVEGGLEVEILNGRNLRQDYEQSILLGEPVTRIQGNFVSNKRSISLFDAIIPIPVLSQKQNRGYSSKCVECVHYAQNKIILAFPNKFR